jgi:hypothetical protein
MTTAKKKGWTLVIVAGRKQEHMGTPFHFRGMDNIEKETAEQNSVKK